jgi:hypothetical protein
MFEILLMMLFILSNLYFNTYNYMYFFIIEHNQLILNLLVIIFYALLNEDFDLNIIDNNENNNINEDLENYINKDKKK